MPEILLSVVLIALVSLQALTNQSVSCYLLDSELHYV